MLRRLTRIFVHYAERYIPDPYIYALILTFVTAAAAFIANRCGSANVPSAAKMSIIGIGHYRETDISAGLRRDA